MMDEWRASTKKVGNQNVFFRRSLALNVADHTSHYARENAVDVITEKGGHVDMRRSNKRDNRGSNCDGCGNDTAPWDLKERSIVGISTSLCPDCRGDSIFTAADAPHFTFDDDAEVRGVGYPAHANDYDAVYEQQQFDCAEVNEVVR